MSDKPIVLDKPVVLDKPIVPDKPQPSDPYYNVVWDNLSWDETPRTIILALVNIVPKVGGPFSTVLGKVWPDPQSTAALIAASEKRMKAWVEVQIEERLAKYDTKQLESKLNGLRQNLDWYDNAAKNVDQAERKRWWEICVSEFNEVAPTFLNPEDYHGSLPLVQRLGTLHIALLREPVLEFEQFYGPGGTDANRQFHAKKLSETIKQYQDFVKDKACPAIIEARRKQISVKNAEPPARLFPRLIDLGRNIDAVLNNGTQIAEQYTESFVNELTINLQRDVLDVALSWSALDPNGARTPSIPKDRLTWIGPVGISQWDYQNNAHGFPLVNGLSHVQTPVVNVLAKHAAILDFLLVWDGGKMRDSNTGELRGLAVGNDRGGTKDLFRVPDGAHIKQVDTYWNYTCMGIQFHCSDGTSSKVFGNGDGRGKRCFSAAYPGHVLHSIAVYGHTGGISEFYFGFIPAPD